MSTVLKFSDASSLGFHAMVIIAEKHDKLVSVKEIASQVLVSEAHLSKVLQRLARRGFVKSVRGPGGGFKLARTPEKIHLLEVYEAIDGELTNTSCLLGLKNCPRKNCILDDLIQSTNDRVRDYLSKTSLADLIE